jgi:ABC-type transporter Mla subunit MlaD
MLRRQTLSLPYGSRMRLGSLVRLAITSTMRAVDVALALPRIALALERIADAADDVRRLADVTPAIEAIGALASEARRLVGDPARFEDLGAAIAAIIRIGDMATTMGPLGDAVRQLNTAAAALTTTVTPLQGASERLGRLVDRLPAAAKPKRGTDVDLA